MKYAEHNRNFTSISFHRFKDGKPITFSSTYGKYGQSLHFLQIREVVEQDAGRYTLVLKNEQAELMEQVTLQLAVNGKWRVK